VPLAILTLLTQMPRLRVGRLQTGTGLAEVRLALTQLLRAFTLTIHAHAPAMQSRRDLVCDRQYLTRNSQRDYDAGGRTRYNTGAPPGLRALSSSHGGTFPAARRCQSVSASSANRSVGAPGQTRIKLAPVSRTASGSVLEGRLRHAARNLR
jgi:hypothetical protein